jgi:DNA-binding HxlR family transcriptional regulator
LEEIFKALGQKDRLWIVQRLLADGPTKQGDLMSALAQSGRDKLNDGSMSTLIKALVRSGLVERGDKKQDPIRVTNTEQVGRLLQLASALALAATAKAQRAAEAQHAEIRKATINATPVEAAEG